MKREEIIRDLVERSSGACAGQYISIRCDVAREIVALLREQEARVMTREEVIRSNDWIWYQWKNTHCGWTIAVDCDEEWIGWEDLTVDRLCKYGKKWRCWTARPSEQQMRDTKWEEDKNDDRN